MKLATTGYVPLTMTLTVIAEDYETRSDISAVGFQGLTTLDGNGNRRPSRWKALFR